MAINFPLNPTAGDIYTVNGRSWQWDGSTWGSYGTFADPASFKVDTVNDRVGVNLGSATPSYTLDVSGDARVSSDFIVGGDLTVSGTTVTLDSQNLLVEDNIITLNSNVTGTPSLDAGIEVERGDQTNAQLLWDESAGAWVINSDFTVNTSTLHVDTTNNRVGIGTAAPNYPLDVVGDVNVSQSITSEGLTVQGSATIASDFTVDNNTLHVDSTNGVVGIGTTSPLGFWPLTIHGAGVVFTGNDQLVSSNLYNAGFWFQDTGEGFAGQLGFVSGEDQDFYIHSAQGDIRFSAAGVNDVGMVIDSTTNRVGIGTTTPGARLEVAGSGLNATRIEGSVIGSVNDGYEINIVGGTPDSYTNAGGRIRLGGGARGDADIDSIIFMADTTERMRIDSSGNVGIGTTTPSYKLDVAGDIHIFNTNPYLVLTDTDTNADSRISAASGQGSLLLDADYNNEAADTNIVFKSDGTEKARIASSGNFGIGTTNPIYTLDVDGDIRMTGSIYWQTPSDTGTQDPVLWIDGGNANVPLIRIGTGSYSTSTDYGFTIQYDGTGAGDLNNLAIYSDNGNSTQIKALTITQDARFGFGGVTDPQAKLHVSASTTPLLYLRQSTNGNGARIQFTDQSTEAQKGYMTYVHSDSASYGHNNAFIFDSTEATMTVVSTDDFTAVGTLTQNYSDERLKTIHGIIPNALEKLSGIRGYLYTQNETADSLGFKEVGIKQVGVSAQEVMAVLPEVVTVAPISYTDKTEEEYYTVRYERMIPLLIETIHELTARIEALEVN